MLIEATSGVLLLELALSRPALPLLLLCLRTCPCWLRVHSPWLERAHLVGEPGSSVRRVLFVARAVPRLEPVVNRAMCACVDVIIGILPQVARALLFTYVERHIHCRAGAKSFTEK